MAAVKPIEYKHDSSSGIAKAGETADITPTNANAVQKDVNLGYTVKPDPAQKKTLERYADDDEIEYSAEEMKQVGTQQVNAEGEDGENLKEKDQKAGSNAAVAVSATGAAVAATSSLAVAMLGKACDGFTGGVLAIADMALAATSLALSIPSVYDPNIDERKNQTGAAATNNETINNYNDQLSSDIDAMDEDSATYQELSAQQTAADVETITEIGALEGDILTYEAQGNTQKVAELRKQIAEIKEEKEGDTGTKDEMVTLNENLESYSLKYQEAVGVKESGETVSQFLQAGAPMETKAKWIQGLQMAASLASIATIVMPKFLFDVAPALIATVQFVAAGLIFGTAATMMGKNASAEGEAASAGDEMAGYVANLADMAAANSDATNETTSIYEATDQAATEEVAENQKETDKALQNQAKGNKNGPAEPESPVDPEKPNGGTEDNNGGEQEAA